jgi:hypothetical protein
MKILCWSCGEPRDDMDEFCPQCGAGKHPIRPVAYIDIKEEITSGIHKGESRKGKKDK